MAGNHQRPLLIRGAKATGAKNTGTLLIWMPVRPGHWLVRPAAAVINHYCSCHCLLTKECLTKRRGDLRNITLK